MADVFQSIWQEHILHWVWPLVQFIIGLGVVIFFHELGHFLAAWWAGIKVERFALGFGPRVAGFVRGETDYCICALPLGGYVKMLGQEDFGALDEADTVDPRSFNAKPVGKRMVVIAAGVVMNVLLAGLLFIVVSMIGRSFPAPVVGDTSELFPAAHATIIWTGEAPPNAADSTGLQGGDRVVRIHGGNFFARSLGQEVNHFAEIQMKAALADLNDTFAFDFERTIDGKVYTGRAELGVRMNTVMGMPAFGIAAPFDPVILAAGPGAKLQPNDQVLQVAGRSFPGPWVLSEIARSSDASAVEVTILRDGKEMTVEVTPEFRTRSDVLYLADGSSLTGWQVTVDPLWASKPQEVAAPDGGKVTVRPEQVLLENDEGKLLHLLRENIAGGGAFSHLDVLGMSPPLRIRSVSPDSPAAKAGLAEDDVILSYGGVLAPSWYQFLEVSEKALRSAEQGGGPSSLVVLREGKSVSLSITPTRQGDRAVVGVRMDVDTDTTQVGHIRPNSPIASAGLEPRAEILAVNGSTVSSWLELYHALREAGDEPVTLRVSQSGQQRDVALGAVGESLQPDAYTFPILTDVAWEPKMVTIAYHNPFKALGWGARETYRQIIGAYGTLRSLSSRTVDTSQVRGPVGIAQVGVMAARESLLNLVYLMAIISAALAVMNFLPLPVLDGGLAVMLLIEKVRGKPLPLKVVNIVQVAGLVLILGLFVVITWNDIARLFSESF
jgi:regulator of sigma E protease